MNNKKENYIETNKRNANRKQQHKMFREVHQRS